jgi:hypothetical protein
MCDEAFTAMPETFTWFSRRLGCDYSLSWSYCLLASTGSAIACGSGKVLFEDKFDTLDPAWGFPDKDDDRSNGPGGLVYKLAPADHATFLNQAGLYDDYEVCVLFNIEGPDNGYGYVSADFWGSNNDNFYGADIYPIQGTYDVYRVERSKTLYPVSEKSDASIVKGSKTDNEISVTVKGNKSTVAFNGKKVIDFTGQPPDGGSVFGFSFGTSKDDSGPSTLTIKSIQVREVEGSH